MGSSSLSLWFKPFTNDITQAQTAIPIKTNITMKWKKDVVNVLLARPNTTLSTKCANAAPTTWFGIKTIVNASVQGTNRFLMRSATFVNHAQVDWNSMPKKINAITALKDLPEALIVNASPCTQIERSHQVTISMTKRPDILLVLCFSSFIHSIDSINMSEWKSIIKITSSQ